MSPNPLQRPFLVIPLRRPRLVLGLVAGTLAGGCSRDAPFTGPDAESDPAIVIPVVAAAPAKASDADAGDAVDDALTRLVPSLGTWGAPLRDALLRLQERKKDETAWTNVQRVIEAVATTLPEEYRPDFDALRLELGIAISQ